ncbi:MAG TPA: multidrug ABC transporter ATP-binding protein [Microscillaceae bacterium]|jgi:ABC transporter fused permease/ATP-binding protein|nr:multidrug ABC transporter ATP-binding protein [Microscillaceae bacterium]
MAKRFGSTDDNDTNPPKKIARKDLAKALRIFRFILPYRFTFGVGMLFLLFSTLTALSFPYLAGKLLDSATQKTGETWSINQVSLILLVVLLVQAFFSFFRILLFVRVSEKAMQDIRLALYSHIITLPLPFFEKKRVGELISRLTADITQLQDVLSFTLAEFFRQIATLIIGIALLLVTSAKLTALMLSTFPVLIIVAIFIGRHIRKVSKKTQDVLAETNVMVEETLQSIQAVKSFTNERYEIARYGTGLQTVFRYALQAAKLRGVFASFIIFGLFGAIILVLWYGVQLVAAGEITVGDLTSFIIYTAFIGGAVGGLGEMYAQLQRTVGASDRILEILDETPELSSLAPQPNEAPPVKGKIQFEQVHFTYPTRPDMEVLHAVNLSIEAGQKVALVGHSGAGKSTVVQLLSRFYAPEKGQISIDGQPLAHYDLSYLRKQIGIVPQEVLLFGGSIQENIAYGNPQASAAEIEKAARQANAWQFIETFPEGLQTLVGERGVKLSGGQKQRIAIARALLKNPAILILDEATSSLDAESERLVQEALDQLMLHRTTLIIAHRLATVRKADLIYVLDKGRVVESGTHEQLNTLEKGIYRHLVKLQFEIEQQQPSSSLS